MTLAEILQVGIKAITNIFIPDFLNASISFSTFSITHLYADDFRLLSVRKKPRLDVFL